MLQLILFLVLIVLLTISYSSICLIYFIDNYFNLSLDKGQLWTFTILSIFVTPIIVNILLKLVGLNRDGNVLLVSFVYNVLLSVIMVVLSLVLYFGFKVQLPKDIIDTFF